MLEERYRLKSLGSALDILECFLHNGPELGVSEIAHLIGMSKSAVHKVLTNLVARGYVLQDQVRGRYQLGLKLWELGTAAVDQMPLRDIAVPYLRELTDATGETSHLAVYESGEVVYIEKVSTAHAVQAYTRIGGRAPAYCVATGKVLLAYQPREERDAVANGPLKRHTPRTVINGPQLLAELERIAAQGFAVNTGEWRIDVVGAAAPIEDKTHTVVAAIGMSGPSSRLTPERAQQEVPTVVRIAGAVSSRLGRKG